MFLYRVAHKSFFEDLSGTGARLFGGRWNSQGYAVVYTSATVELAMLESLCHNTFSSLIRHFGLITLEVPDKVSMQEILIKDLPKNWRSFPPPSSLAKMGDRWLTRKSGLLLKVPSVIFPSSFNYLLNPAHADFDKMKVANRGDFNIDVRLLENLKK